MPDAVDIKGAIERQLLPEMVAFLAGAGEVAAGRGQSLYLVGGVVRDLLLGRPTLDLDLAVDRDAPGLAEALAARAAAGSKPRLVVHRRFNTARLSRDEWSVDIATVRSETYDRPGALPRVGPGTLETDLFRRDFTVNAMAIELTAGGYGRLVDLYGGRQDLARRLIRVLHANSFTDDPTRIWRSIRYEQRLGFRLEPATLKLLKRDVPVLGAISGDRIRHELELVLKEALPEKVLKRAGQLGVLAGLHPSLKADGWLARKFRQARSRVPAAGLPAVYLALLGYGLPGKDVAELTGRLNLPRSAAQDMIGTAALREGAGALLGPGVGPARVYDLLGGFSHTAIAANGIAAGDPAVRRHISDYLERLRYVKPVLTGDDLAGMGIPPGPEMKAILRRLLEARLEGGAASRRDEIDLVTRELGIPTADRHAARRKRSNDVDQGHHRLQG